MLPTSSTSSSSWATGDEFGSSMLGLSPPRRGWRSERRSCWRPSSSSSSTSRCAARPGEPTLRRAGIALAAFGRRRRRPLGHAASDGGPSLDSRHALSVRRDRSGPARPSVAGDERRPEDRRGHARGARDPLVGAAARRARLPRKRAPPRQRLRSLGSLARGARPVRRPSSARDSLRGDGLGRGDTRFSVSTNGKPGRVVEPFWDERGLESPEIAAAIDGARTLYLVRLRRETGRFPVTARIEREIAADPSWREVVPEPETSGWRAVSLRKYVPARSSFLYRAR